jgi:hypothetical protein
MGTITVTCAPCGDGFLAVERTRPYGQVQQGSFKQIVQPFGVLTPRITDAAGVTTMSGTGLYPNSNLTVTAKYTVENDAGPIEGTILTLSPSPGRWLVFIHRRGAEYRCQYHAGHPFRHGNRQRGQLGLTRHYDRWLPAGICYRRDAAHILVIS